MPRYFFDILESGRYLRDEKGILLPDDETARAEARRTLGEMTSETLTFGARTGTLDLIVRRDDGAIVASMALTFSEEPRAEPGSPDGPPT